ncbi:cellulase family glycosylhydrolase [Pyxidicoccus parkwayensis]|uniref:Cellulase family glycosylhydrolase n=1 Tax=Pyxidicoccus parkwayensis TaxID=2813578 RepID=A0ABX7NNU7_9BACT|nr:cellulase family glycosylhydrolase [Pyxidicoccus parkwaysis]QSQ20098.1 cellulase family glycosylhydrolase [Pyxidicoccus parkwaysis]
MVLLQTRLNALPSARPLLDVDGDFGPKTLQRVKEFQASGFVNGVVDAGTWSKLLDAPPAPRETFFVDGRHLHDPNGNRVVLRGINLPLLDDWSFPPGNRLADLEKTGSNAVRIQWYIDYGNPNRPGYASADLDAFLTQCKTNRMIPILGLWDVTCDADPTLVNTKLIPWWISDEIVSILNKHRRYLIINLANELGFYRWSGAPAVALDAFKSAHEMAITSIREKLHMPVMLDAPDCGTSIDAWLSIGQELIDHDPDHNLLLSVHAYWADYDGMPHINSTVNANLPIVFGEVANKQGETINNVTHDCFYDLDGLNQNHPPNFGFTYQSLLQTLKTQEIGWLAWSWGPDSCQSRNIGQYAQDSNQFEGLSEPFGNDIVNNPDYGLKASAERSSVFARDGDITPSANSMTTAEGGIRHDPEGFAPARKVNLLTWKDARNADRTLHLGAYLYQYDFSFDDGQRVITRSANDDAHGHPGFGYVVSHSPTGNSPLGKVCPPSNVETTVFLGGHHAIHRVELVYDRDQEGGGFGIQIPVVIEWFVATGRDHPVWAVTWKMGEAANPQNRDFDDYLMDVRGPYGSLNFDGAASRNQGDAIGGVAWGDFGLKFTTTDAQLTLNSPWTYNTPNTVCFTQAWTANENAEMGIVQTRVADKEMGYPGRVVGRERGHTSAEDHPDKGDCTDFGPDNRNYSVPCVNGWPYQLMNSDWDPDSGKPAAEATGTKLLAWGSPIGWLGASGFELFDGSASADGRGDRSYATFIVLGPRFRFDQGGEPAGDVAITIKMVEALNAATISDVQPGSLVTQVARGPGASQLKNITHGYNDTYAAYYLSASDNQVAFSFTPAIGTAVKNPIFVIQNYTTQRLPSITVDGNPVSVNTGADAGAFVSLNPATSELWVTLNATIQAPMGVQIMI